MFQGTNFIGAFLMFEDNILARIYLLCVESTHHVCYVTGTVILRSNFQAQTVRFVLVFGISHKLFM